MKNTLTFIAVEQVSTNQLEEILALSLLCKQKDGYQIPYYPHIIQQFRRNAINLLIYSKQVLVGFMGTFCFNVHQLEITLMVEPNHRKKGIAKQCLEMISTVLDELNIDTLIFSAPHAQYPSLFYRLGMQMMTTEFDMIHNNPPTLNHPPNTQLSIERASTDDVEAIYTLDSACFPQSSLSRERLHLLLLDPNYYIWLGRLNGYVIAKVHAQVRGLIWQLSDIGVHPLSQKQGFASQIILFALNTARTIEPLPIGLSVETNNHQALSLYIQLGFVVKNACDFWQVSRKNFQQQITENLP